ncbi:hypothetical protein [Streptomyces bullii]|uniref:Uncharacterized protein n=1 Tax=Streptomyces bullii TaxID=349910 RepID=A0ABW0UZZ6_9ACTN
MAWPTARLTDAELVTRAVAQAVPAYHCEARWLRFAHAFLRGLFPYLPQRPACNNRLRAALGLVERATRSLAADTDLSGPPAPTGAAQPPTRRVRTGGRPDRRRRRSPGGPADPGEDLRDLANRSIGAPIRSLTAYDH